MRLPAGSQLLLASRRTPPLPVALLRAQGQMVEVGADRLAMDEREARALLEGAGVGLPDAEVAKLGSGLAVLSFQHDASTGEARLDSPGFRAAADWLGGLAAKNCLPKGAAGEAWGARGLPTTLIVDRQGREVAYLEGAIDWAAEETMAVRMATLKTARPSPRT